MTLKEYAASINELAAKYPEALAVYSSDSEGNNFQVVSYAGTLGFFEGSHRGDFTCLDNVLEEPEEYEHLKGKTPNAVCIN